MRVLVITQIYLPEIGALANRMYPIVRQLAAEGHQVFVATGMPNYPQGIVFPEYRGKLFMKERRDNYTILRTACYIVPRNRSKWSQLLSYLSFIPAAFHSGLRAGKVDIVFVTSPPIFPAVAAIWLAKLRGAKLVLDIRDLWPDEMIYYGAASEGSPMVRVVRAIERWMYRSADALCATTVSIQDTVVERGMPREKTLVVPNGADLDLFRPLPRENPVAAEYPLSGRFVVMYSGLFGIKHGLEVLLDAAELLQAQKDILFFLIGSGARRDALVKQVKERRLENVLIADERKVTEIPYILAGSDLCFASVRPESYARKVISVKIFEYFACLKPVVGGLSGESARIVEESGGGIVVPPGDSGALAEAILALYHDPARREAMGKAGRRYVEENYSRSVTAARLAGRLQELYESRGGSRRRSANP